jgi:hypothetical protein
VDDLTISSSGMTDEQELQAKQYKYFELFRTLSSASTTKGEVGGSLLAEDLLTSRAQLVDSAGLVWNKSQGLAVIDFLQLADRQDITQYDQTHITGVPDDDLATGSEYNPVTDAVQNPPAGVLAAAHHRGMTIVATTDAYLSDVSGSAVGETESSRFITLAWSPAHRFAPEIFNSANQYRTRLSADKPVAIATVGQYIVVVGDGPVVRLERSGSTVDILEMPASLDLVGPSAIAEVQGSLLAVCRDNVYLIEPVSNAIMPVEPLARLMRDYWASPPDVISVAYDRQLQAVFIQNAQRAQTVVLWMHNQTITLLADMLFDWVKELNIGGARRAVFISPTGRFVYPRQSRGEESTCGIRGTSGSINPDALTTNGLPRVDLEDSIRGWNLVVRVVQRSEYDPDYGDQTVLKLLVIDPFSGSTASPLRREDGTIGNAPADHYWLGLAVRPLDGLLVDTPLMIWGVEAAGTRLVVPELDAGMLAKLPAGTVLSVGCVPMGVVGASLESAPGQSDPLRKREVSYMAAAVYDLSGFGYDSMGNSSLYDYPLAHVGVIDYSGLGAAARYTSSTLPTGWLARSRYAGAGIPTVKGFLPAADQEYDPDDPSRMLTHLGDSGSVLHV